MRRQITTIIIWAIVAMTAIAQPFTGERLSRGLVAVKSQQGVYLSWRMLVGDKQDMAFDIYRQTNDNGWKKINAIPIKKTSDFTNTTANLQADNRWKVVSEGKTIAQTTMKAGEGMEYLSIPIQRPQGGDIEGEHYEYTANDASVGDLDGDGDYEIVLKWDPTNSKRPPQMGFTGNTLIDAYRMDGTLMWRIDLGRNIRSGAATTNFLVFDFDGDGKAELCCKTGDGTIDGKGNIVGDKKKDWRTYDKDLKTYGKIVNGPEYISIFDGETGNVIDTQEYIPTRYPLDGWGGIGGNAGNDNSGGRSDRFTAAVALLDGKTPSAVMVRGWYGRTVVAAWSFSNGKLHHQWTFDSALPEWNGYSGMGNHNLTVADFDGDGNDEICVGAMTVDHDGKGLYTTGLRHGDALHVGDLIPSRPGLEVFGVHENEGKNPIRLTTPAAAMFDGRTGEVIWQDGLSEDAGRGVAADIDPRYPGAECWSSLPGLRRGDTGETICEKKPSSCNFSIYWDADPLAELLDGTRISKWNWQEERTDLLFEAKGTVSNNWTKANPSLSADILGDWREEVLLPSRDQSELRIYTTTIPATDRRPTLMQDRQYRLSVAWQNVGYNQPPHLSYDLYSEVRDSTSGLDSINFDQYWQVESESPDYKLTFLGDTCEILSPKGMTLWRKDKMNGNVTIEYDACVMDEGIEGDRLSDLNCFWMANDPQYPDDIWQRSQWRSGIFKRCYSLTTYYLGYGGNHNSTTRFRKYNGNERAITDNSQRPAILREYKDDDHLLKANKWYHIKIGNRDGRITYEINGETIVDYIDDNPLTSGWFGFRTTLSRTRIANFMIKQG